MSSLSGLEADLAVIRSLLDPLVVWEDPVPAAVLDAAEDVLGCRLPDDLRRVFGVMGGGNIGTLDIEPFESLIETLSRRLERMNASRWAEPGADEPKADRLWWLGSGNARTVIELDGPDAGRLHMYPLLFEGPFFYHVAWSLADAIAATRVLYEQDLLFSYRYSATRTFTVLRFDADIARVEEITADAACSPHVAGVGFQQRLEPWTPPPDAATPDAGRRVGNLVEDVEAIRSYLGPYATSWGDPLPADELHAGENRLGFALPDDMRLLYSVTGFSENLGSLLLISLSQIVDNFEHEKAELRQSRLEDGSDIGPDEPLTENLFWLASSGEGAASAIELDGPNAGRLLTSTLGLLDGPYFGHLAWSLGDAIGAIREFCEADMYQSHMIRHAGVDAKPFGVTKVRHDVMVDDVVDIATRWGCSPALIAEHFTGRPAPPKPQRTGLSDPKA